MTPRLRRALFGALRIAVGLAVIAGFVLFLRGLDRHALLAALRRAALLPVLAAAVLNFVHMFAKAVRWRLMLAPVARVGVWRLFRYTVANYAASTLLPARMGEVVRVWLLKRRDGVPVTVAGAVALVEKVLEALAMLVFVAPVPWLVPGLPGWVDTAVIGLAVVAGAAFVGGSIALRRARPESWLGRVALGADVLRRPRALALSLLVSVAAWTIDTALIWLVLRALGFALPWTAALVVLLTVNLAVAVPSTPGQVGAFELGAVVGLGLLGVPREEALAFAIVYHALQVVPLALIGLGELRLIATVRASTASTDAVATT